MNVDGGSFGGCVIRFVTPSSGYVSARQVGAIVPPPEPSRLTKNPPYVSCMEAASIPSGQLPKEASHPTMFPPYVELTGDKWSQPRPPSLAAATPAEGEQFAGRVGQLPRPNTTEATMGYRRPETTNPCLSKQSSGYVSQETIAPCEAVVMSPKRLLTQATTPHTIVMSPSHQSSMV